MKKPRVKKSREILAHIDNTKKVRVYRNLHKDCFSVKQAGLVRCHVDQVTLSDCKFIVSKAGQKRVRDEKRKNVHAFVEGFVVDTREADEVVDGSLTDEQIMLSQTNWEHVYYSPYTCKGFVTLKAGNVVESAKLVDLHSDYKLILTYEAV